MADNEAIPCSLNNFSGDGFGVIEGHDPFDLCADALDQAEVSSGNANDGGKGFSIVEGLRIEGDIKGCVIPFEQKPHLIFAERFELMHKAHTRIELWISG